MFVSCYVRGCAANFCAHTFFILKDDVYLDVNNYGKFF